MRLKDTTGHFDGHGSLAAIAEGVAIIVDCLTVWLGNLMHHGLDDDAIGAASDASIRSAAGFSSLSRNCRVYAEKLSI